METISKLPDLPSFKQGNDIRGHTELALIRGLFNFRKLIFVGSRYKVGVTATQEGGYFMIAGHLREKSGYYYAVLNYTLVWMYRLPDCPRMAVFAV